MRLWKTKCEDEGVRAVCNYVAINNNVVILELLDNAITPLGCQFLGKLFAPEARTNLVIVKLDHNSIGSEGLKYLAEGLCRNSVVTNLSLTYCDIDQDGARSLFEILIYNKSQLEELNLGGNHLRNPGTIEVLKGVSIAKNLKKIFLSDNQFDESDDVLAAIEKCFNKNQNLGRYDFRFNFLSDYGVEKIIEYLEEAKHVYEVEIPERISSKTLEDFRSKIAENKPKKKAKGKKKKK